MLNFKLNIPKGLHGVLKTEAGFSGFIASLMETVRKEYIANTPEDSGFAKQSWTPVRRIDGGYSFGNRAHYASVLQSGSAVGELPWPSVGPKTAMADGRIYSSQAVGGITKQFDQDKIVDDAVKTFVRSLQ